MRASQLKQEILRFPFTTFRALALNDKLINKPKEAV
jgi:hypothetical protein